MVYASNLNTTNEAFAALNKIINKIMLLGHRVIDVINFEAFRSIKK